MTQQPQEAPVKKRKPKDFAQTSRVLRLLDALVEAEARAEKAEKERDVLAKLVASGGFDCPGSDGECPYGGGEDACICVSRPMGSDMRCWVDWAAAKAAKGEEWTLSLNL